MSDLVNLTDLKKYLFPGETNIQFDIILATLISAISGKVIGEIGCDLLHTHYSSEEVSANGRSRFLDVKNWPITAVSSVTDQDGNALTQGHSNDYIFDKFSIISNDGPWAKGDLNYIVSYEAGYAEVKSISAFANYGTTISGTVLATSGAHGMAAGTTANVTISGTTNYNGVYTVTYVNANSFYFTATWVANETGYWANPALPADIALVCYEQIAQVWKTMKDKTWGEGSRNYPDGSVQLNNTDGGFTKEQMRVLNKYKRPKL
jgi:hypothetical protein